MVSPRQFTGNGSWRTWDEHKWPGYAEQGERRARRNCVDSLSTTATRAATLNDTMRIP
ncbi:hypothetical protein [Rothia sp. LK2492]|uniref:hypothetical protein n=1 Tax=Rothia sp. LK2492 TaxID=3114370 RepID=UPI0034CF3187